MKAWKAMSLKGSTIFLLIEYEGRTGGYIPEVLGIRKEHSKHTICLQSVPQYRDHTTNDHK